MRGTVRQKTHLRLFFSLDEFALVVGVFPTSLFSYISLNHNDTKAQRKAQENLCAFVSLW